MKKPDEFQWVIIIVVTVAIAFASVVNWGLIVCPKNIPPGYRIQQNEMGKYRWYKAQYEYGYTKTRFRRKARSKAWLDYQSNVRSSKSSTWTYLEE